jgi:hypothetical protein
MELETCSGDSFFINTVGKVWQRSVLQFTVSGFCCSVHGLAQPSCGRLVVQSRFPLPLSKSLFVNGFKRFKRLF